MTNEQLQAHLTTGKVRNYGAGRTDVVRMPCARITCADGFSVSVQANTTAYCTPRDLAGPYTHVELGYPSLGDELITAFAEDPEHLTETVYPQVPVETILELINKHGGAV
jgi:hypothetical protein